MPPLFADHNQARIMAIRAEAGGDDASVPGDPDCHPDRLLPDVFPMTLLFPTDPTALEQVKGMGPHKVKMYGSALLEALQ